MDTSHAYENRDAKMEPETSCIMQKYLESWCKHSFSGCSHGMISPSFWQRKKPHISSSFKKALSKNFTKMIFFFFIYTVPEIWRKVRADTWRGTKEGYFLLVNTTLMQIYLYGQMANTYKNIHLSVHLGSESTNKVQPRFHTYCKLLKVLVIFF